MKYEPFSNNPPTPVIKAGGTNIASTEGSYCWDGLLYAQCVDKIYASALDLADNYKPKAVAPNEEITIKFRKKPSDPIELFSISKGNSKEKVPFINNKFHTPNESGVYYYYVTTRWKQGGGNYGFSIEVK